MLLDTIVYKEDLRVHSLHLRLSEAMTNCAGRSLPVVVAQTILDYVPYDDLQLSKWQVFVGEYMQYTCLRQHFLHLYHMSRRYPDYKLIFDLIPMQDFDDLEQWRPH